MKGLDYNVGVPRRRTILANFTRRALLLSS